MLYGIKNWEIYKISLPNITTELSRVATEIPCLPNGRASAKDQVNVEFEQISVEDKKLPPDPLPPVTSRAYKT